MSMSKRLQRHLGKMKKDPIGDAQAGTLARKYCDGGALVMLADNGAIDNNVRRDLERIVTETKKHSGDAEIEEIVSLSEYVRHRCNRGPVPEWLNLEPGEETISDADARRLASEYYDGALYQLACSGAINDWVRREAERLGVEKDDKTYQFTKKNKCEIKALLKYIWDHPNRDAVPGWSDLPWSTLDNIRPKKKERNLKRSALDNVRPKKKERNLNL